MKLRTAFFLLILSCYSCSTSARFRMREGPPEDGEILRRTQDKIELRQTDGTSKLISTNDVLHVDHPGNVLALVGGAATLGGLAYGGLGLYILKLSSDFPVQDDTSPHHGDFRPFFGTTFLAFGIGLVAAGIPMFVWGTQTWTNSKENLEGPGLDGFKVSIGNGTNFSIEATF